MHYSYQPFHFSNRLIRIFDFTNLLFSYRDLSSFDLLRLCRTTINSTFRSYPAFLFLPFSVTFLTVNLLLVPSCQFYFTSNHSLISWTLLHFTTTHYLSAQVLVVFISEWIYLKGFYVKQLDRFLLQEYRCLDHLFCFPFLDQENLNQESYLVLVTEK